MKKLVIINDVETELELGGLTIGNTDAVPTEQALKDSVVIAKEVCKEAGTIQHIASSDASRVSRILHFIRLGHIDAKVKILTSLRERSFGVLSNSIISKESEIFTHGRICAEEGESISQCRDRILRVTRHYDATFSKTSLLIISHPYICQILMNVLLNKPITDLSEFWLSKGSFMILDGEPVWKFRFAKNILQQKMIDKIEELK